MHRIHIESDGESERLETLARRLSSTLLQLPGSDIGMGFEEALRQIAGILDADRCTLVELAPDSPAAETTHTWARSGVLPFEVAQDLPRLHRLLERAQPDDSAGSSLAVPIDMANQRICALFIDGLRRPREWAASTLAGLRFIGEILAGSLHRRRQESAIERTVPDDRRRHRDVELDEIRRPEPLRAVPPVKEVIGDSPAFKDALNRVRDVAPTDATVLLLGETGTGKENIARALHEASSRRNRPLIRVNCAALPGSLIESELFGHERGAFTGAVTARQGRFELADRGTIFLDEIGDLPLELQPKLLRVLQEGEFERIGSSRTRQVDVRIIAATHRNLEAAVEAGTFRADLYYRISVFPISLPPLRERRTDIPQLAWFFIQQRCRRLHRTINDVPAAVMQSLQRYDWPGNVRELENVIERAMIRSSGDTLVLDQSLSEGTLPVRESAPLPGQATLEDVERQHVADVLKVCGWRINGPGNAAQRLGLHPNTLRFRMKKLGISRPVASGF